MLRIDHVLRAVRDLDEAGSRLLDEHGLASVPGGRHDGWGTANRIVPLGDDYLELVAVVDEREAATAPFGRWAAAAAADGDRWAGWVVRTDELDRLATDRGLEVVDGARRRPDGAVLRWRMAGLDRALGDPQLPFFIEWLVPVRDRPGRTVVHHPAGPRGLSRLELSGDESQLRAWLGAADLPVSVARGAPGVRAVVLASAAGELVLRDA